MSPGRKHTNSRIIITVASTAAAIVILFIAGVNTSTAFAATLSDIPIIGSIVKVVTGRSFSEKNDNVTIKSRSMPLYRKLSMITCRNSSL